MLLIIDTSNQQWPKNSCISKGNHSCKQAGTSKHVLWYPTHFLETLIFCDILIIAEQVALPAASAYFLCLHRIPFDRSFKPFEKSCSHGQVLLSKGVEESKILFLCLIAAPAGIHQLCGKYPALKVVTSEIDQGLDEQTFEVVPGMLLSATFEVPEEAPWNLRSAKHVLKFDLVFHQYNL